MQESVIATFNDVQFIQGVTPMTQKNWQEYFGTTIKSGVYSGFSMGNKDAHLTPHAIYDGVAIANGIRAEIKTELGYTLVELPEWEDDPDQFICLRIHFLSETAELISKRDIAQQEYAGQTRNEYLLHTMLDFEMDESYMCTRNNQYYDIPLFYSAGDNTWLYFGRDLRRIINKEPNYMLNPYEFEILGDNMTHRLLSGSNYYSVDKTKEITTFYPDVVDITKMAVLTFDVAPNTQEIRLSKIPFVNNFLRAPYPNVPVPEGLWDRWKIKYIFSTEDWTEYPDYYSYSKVAGDKKVFRISFRGASTEGTAPNVDYNFNFFVEEIYNYQTTSWGAIGGHITDQIDLSTKLDELSQSTTDISEILALKAPVASPVFTGTPTAPTAELGTVTDQIATTAFVGNELEQALSTIEETLYVQTGGIGDGTQADPFGKISDAVTRARLGVTTNIVVVGDFISNDYIVIPHGKKIILSNSRNGFDIRITGNYSLSAPTIVVDGGALFLDNASYIIIGREGTQSPVLVKNGGLFYFNSPVHTSEDLDNKAKLSIIGRLPSSFGGALHVTTLGRAFLSHNNNDSSDITFAGTGNGVRCDSGGYVAVEKTINVSEISYYAFYADNGMILQNGVNGTDDKYRVNNGGAISAGGFASLASPAFTGTPTAPTPASGDNSTRLATTEFVSSAVSSKAPLASPAFTGTPTAPTPASGDNSTRLATTEFVKLLVSETEKEDILYVNDPSSTPNFVTIQAAIDYADKNKLTKIYIFPGRYQANIKIDGKQIYLGCKYENSYIELGGESDYNPIISVVNNGILIIESFNKLWCYLRAGSAVEVDNASFIIKNEVSEERTISIEVPVGNAGGDFLKLQNFGKFKTEKNISFDIGYNDKDSNYVDGLRATDGSIAILQNFSSVRQTYKVKDKEGYDIVSDKSAVYYKSYTGSYTPILLEINAGNIYKTSNE